MRLTPLLVPLLLLVAAPAAAQSAHDRLFALFTASDEAELKRHPIEALGRGDLRYAGQVGALYTDQLEAADIAAARADLAALHNIDRAALDPTDRLAWDVFDHDTALALRG